MDEEKNMERRKTDILKDAKKIMQKYSEMESGEQIFYVTTCGNNTRGNTWKTSSKTFEKAWHKVERYLNKTPQLPRWTRIEFQVKTQRMSAATGIRRFAQTKRGNYFGQGIAFRNDGSCSFLQEEISSNALLVPYKGHKMGLNHAKLEMNLGNIRGYIKRRNQRIVPNPLAYFDAEWDLFETRGIMIEDGIIYTLETDFFGRGMRKITKENQPEMLKETIETGMDFLFDQIKEDGSFIYGYYPAYNNPVRGYNGVRHFSSLYALLETLEYSDLNKRTYPREKLLEKIDKGLEWGLLNLCIEVDGILYVSEKIKGGRELKLGGQALGILALAKYESLTGDDHYHQIMLNLVEGLRAYIDEEGRTVHVLNEDLSVREAFRIIYYNGEALFALMRAYPLIGDERLLKLGELLMDRYIIEGYQRYHDHWLSYSVNELTLYLPKKEYFEFGVKNALENLTFMEERDTAYPTFLELLCAANKMFKRIEESPFADELFTNDEYRRLREVTEKRALHEMRTGHMWPEYAMFFAKPETILHGFYSRHDRTRMRIDDAEHFLSGLINYTYLRNDACYHFSHDDSKRTHLEPEMQWTQQEYSITPQT